MNNLSKYVVCPYFHSDQPSKILCEGVQKNTSNHLVFQDCKDKKPYMQEFCFSMENHKNCRICDMLDLKNCIDKDDSNE